MDGFFGYNQIQIVVEDQHKMALMCPWGTFMYWKLPSGLKDIGAMFQRAMLFTFHDLKHIVEAYMDDLIAHSCKRVDHPTHLRLVFERCHYYCIRLNPNKCIFYVILGHLLGLIVSNKGITVDPLKVEEIVQLFPPWNIFRLQSLQEKAIFLCRFIPNYDDINKSFMCLLNKGVLFC